MGLGPRHLVDSLAGFSRSILGGSASARGAGGFPILFGGGFLSDTYPDVFRCILHVSCMYSEGYMYPLCILMYLKMYLKCPVTFQENTCILMFCMYFTRIPNESKIHFGIHIRYIKIHVSWALPWCHTGYMNRTHQDTIRIYARYIEIHQDTYPIGTPPQKG